MARANSRHCCIKMQHWLLQRVTFSVRMHSPRSCRGLITAQDNVDYAPVSEWPIRSLQWPIRSSKDNVDYAGGLLTPEIHTFTLARPRQLPVFGRNWEVPIGGLPHKMTLLDHQLHRQNIAFDTKIMQFWSRYIKSVPAQTRPFSQPL